MGKSFIRLFFVAASLLLLGFPALGYSSQNEPKIASITDQYVITESGELWLWYCGCFSSIPKSPIRVGNESNWKSITIIDKRRWNESAYALTTSGELWQLRHGGDHYYSIPQTGPSVKATRVGTSSNWESVITLGSSISFAITTEGELWAWGSNYYGTLGLPDYVFSRNEPTRIGTASNWKSLTFTGLYGAVYATTTTGELWTWGGGVYEPTRVGDASNWKSITSSNNSSRSLFATTTNGELWAWGANSKGQLGLGHNYPVSQPTRVGDFILKSGITILPGYSAIGVCAVTTTGEMFAWGENFYGQLGLGDRIDRNVPVLVGESSNWTSVTSGNHSTLAINNLGELWAWGDSVNGGDIWFGQTPDCFSPRRIGNDSNWASVFKGTHKISYTTIDDGDGTTVEPHTSRPYDYAITLTSELWELATYSYEELGSDKSDRYEFVRVGDESNWELVGATMLDGYTDLNYATTTNGELWAWGTAARQVEPLRISFVAQSDPPPVVLIPTALSITGALTSTPLTVGQARVLGFVVVPSDANKSVTWMSSDTKVATVSDGIVQAVSAGTATITVRSTVASVVSNSVTIKVQAPTPTSLSITNTLPMTPLVIGESRTLGVSVVPSNATNTVTWTCSNTKVATVSNGVVKGIKAGTAIVTVCSTVASNVSKSTTIKVVAPKSANNKLKAITLSNNIKLNRKFAQNTITYKATLPKKRSAVTIRATKANSKATVQFRTGSGKWKTAGSCKVTVKNGNTVKLQIRVRAEVGGNWNSYTVIVTRKK